MESQPISPGGKPDIVSTRKPTVSNETVKKSTPTPTSSRVVEDTVTISSQSKEIQPRPVESTKPPENNKVVQGSGVSDKQTNLSVTDHNDVVMRVVDKDTQKVVKQIPSEEQLNLKNALRDVVDDITQGDS